MKPTTIYIVRHGESIFNEQGLWSGHSNPKMTAKGRAQIEATRRAMRDVQFDLAYSSDVSRLGLPFKLVMAG